MELHPQLAPLGVLLLVLFRALGLFLTAPVLSARLVPVTVKVTAGGAMALAVFIGLPEETLGASFSVGQLVTGAVRETALGALAGFVARVAMDAAFSAGYAASSAMGLNFGAVVSPGTGSDSTAVSELLAMGALVLGAVLGLHREAVVWLMASMRTHPLGAPVAMREEVLSAVMLCVPSLNLGVRLAFPVIAAVIVGQVAWGLANRTAAQLNLSSVGFSVTILCGGLMLYVTAPFVTEVVAQAAVATLARG